MRTQFVIPLTIDGPHVNTTLASSVGLHKPWWAAGALVMILTAIISLAGLSTAPIEGHEIFVVETAREMRERGDWVLPYFNDQPRLNKPPLNYWMTAAISVIAGDAYVQTWHGRLVSSLGGLLMVAMTLWTGSLLMNRSLGITAGILISTSVGYLMFAQDGRPDMLYAGLCTAMIPLWLWTWQSCKNHHPRRARLGIYSLYVALSLATLSKGPHIPLLFLGSFIIITWLRERAIQKSTRLSYTHSQQDERTPWRLCFQIFRPFTGLLLTLLIVAPWWLAIYARIGDDLFHTQLAGKRYGMGLLAIANPYYFYRGLVVILPWCLLWVFAVVTLFKKTRQGHIARMMFTIVMITLLALSMAKGKRLVYILPLFCPMFILITLGIQQLTDAIRNHPKLRSNFHLWHACVYTLVALALIIITSLRHTERLMSQNLWWIPLAGIAGTLITAAMAVYFSRPPSSDQWLLDERTAAITHKRTTLIAVRGGALIFAWFLFVSNIAGTTSSPKRWTYEQGSTFVSNTLHSDAPLYAMNIRMEPFVYFNQHPIHEFRAVADLKKALKETTQSFYLLTNQATAFTLTQASTSRSIERIDDPQTPFVLVHIGPSVVPHQIASAMPYESPAADHQILQN